MYSTVWTVEWDGLVDRATYLYGKVESIHWTLQCIPQNGLWNGTDWWIELFICMERWNPLESPMYLFHSMDCGMGRIGG